MTLERELVAWDTRSQRLVHTGSDVSRLLGSFGDRTLLSVGERGGDRNGDGDSDDGVLAVYDGRTGTVHNLRLATGAQKVGLAPDSHGVVLVPEVQQGKDLNDDGDLHDIVLHEVFLDPPQG